MKTTVATMYGGKLRIRTAAMVNASMDGSRPCGTAGNRRWFGRQERETAGQTRDGEEFWNSVSLSMCDLQATVWAWAEVAVQIPSSLRTLGFAHTGPLDKAISFQSFFLFYIFKK